MTAQCSEQVAAAREEQFLAMLRDGVAPGGNGSGLFDAPSLAGRQPTLHFAAQCEARERPAASPPASIAWSLPNLCWRMAWHAWRFVRELSGDDAYERYLAHVVRVHPEQVPMTRAEHYAFTQNEKWNRLSRCC